MRNKFAGGWSLKILLVGVVIALLGFYPVPEAVSSSLGKAYYAQQAENYEAVASNLVIVAEQQPWRSGLWEVAGVAELATGESASASVYFTRAAAKGELSPHGYLAWGDAEWQNGNTQTALQIWEIGARIGASQGEILPRQAEAYRISGDDRALIKTLRAILEHQSIAYAQPANTASLAYELGLLLAAHDPETALIYLLQAVELDPLLESKVKGLILDIQEALVEDDPAYLLMIAGRSLANLGYWDHAAKAFENAIELRPEYAEAWAYLGEAWQHTLSGGDPLGALAKALELDPDSIAGNAFTALYWQRQGDYELAIAYLQTVAKLDPENPAYLLEIGNLMALSGDLDAGKDYYYQAIALSPGDPMYLREFLKFSTRFNLDLREVALPVARQLVMLNPDDAIYLDLMGEILFWLGDMISAERFFLRALAQDPDYDQAHIHLGNLYRSQGRDVLASYHYERVLELSDNELLIAHAQEALNPSISP
jgi:tetratricopeptide (TPR) repeat protein